VAARRRDGSPDDGRRSIVSDSSNDIVDVLLDQHAQIRGLLEEVSTAVGAQARRGPFEALVRLLAVHEAAEEQVLHPVARLRLPEGDQVADARIAEEEESKRLLAQLERLGTDHDDFGARFARLRELVLLHARNEEREEFPGVREHYSEQDRRTLGDAFKAAELAAPTHPHPHDPDRPPANLVAGPAIAAADHVRDALRRALSGSKRAS
jgi:hemerythrin superfamily protein